MLLAPTIRLVRLETSDNGTFGTWIVNDDIFCNTLELPWRMNTPFVSCIYTGQFTMKRVQSNKHGNTFRVADVYGRSGINIHSANKVTQLEGCIALGESIKKLKSNQRHLMNSGNTFKRWLQIMDDHDEAKLTIIDCY